MATYEKNLSSGYSREEKAMILILPISKNNRIILTIVLIVISPLLTIAKILFNIYIEIKYKS